MRGSVLVVSGGRDDRSVATALEEAGYAVDIADGIETCLAVLDGIDCVVTRDDLPDGDGVALVDAVRDERPTVPVVLCPRTGSEHIASDAVAAGVTEYVPSASADDVDRIEAAVSRALDEDQSGRQSASDTPTDGDTDALTTFFRDIPAPAVEYEFEGDTPVIRSVNRSFTETFGYDGEAVAGQSIDEVIVPEGKRDEAAALDRQAREGKQLAAELRRETSDGTREFLLRTIGVEGSDADIDGYAVYIDITEQKERERALQRQNERLDEFASVVSHDLRNPLSVVKNRINMAHQTGDLDHLERARDAVDRMDNLLRELLQLSRRGESVGRRESVAVDSVAETAWQHVATDGATLDVESNDRLEADAGRLAQLLENLFINAVENADTTVTVTVGLDGDCLYVADDGPGIPEDRRDRIFETGYSERDDGTGYGLTIVRQVAQAHGWDVDVSTGADGGARFEFRGVERVTE